MILRGVVLVLCAASVASAQIKPIGAYDADGAPAWVTFGPIASWADDATVQRAVARSAATGFKWIVQFGFDVFPTLPAGDVVPAQWARLTRLGLAPYIAAVVYGEEWHERCLQGDFTAYGLPAWSPSCGPVIAAWLGQQHAAVRAATGRPVIWVTGMVAPGRLVPANTDYVAIDAYPQDGDPFSAVEGVYALSAQYTTLPLIAVMRWHRATGPYQGPGWQQGSREPDPAWAEGYARLVAHPRIVAAMGFLWASRPYADLVGLADMPVYQAAVKRSLGVP